MSCLLPLLVRIRQLKIKSRPLLQCLITLFTFLPRRLQCRLPTRLYREYRRGRRVKPTTSMDCTRNEVSPSIPDSRRMRRRKACHQPDRRAVRNALAMKSRLRPDLSGGILLSPSVLSRSIPTERKGPAKNPHGPRSGGPTLPYSVDFCSCSTHGVLSIPMGPMLPSTVRPFYLVATFCFSIWWAPHSPSWCWHSRRPWDAFSMLATSGPLSLSARYWFRLAHSH